MFTIWPILFVNFIFTRAAWIKEMEDPNLYQGDMVLSPEQQNEVKNGKFGYASSQLNLWPKGQIIAYEIATSIDAVGVKAIKDAIDDYHKYTCIQFKPRTNENSYFYFYRGAGCSSPVGFRGYYNSISLARNCWKKGVVMHEMAHSLGLFHEQSRLDRDNYVKILWENIQGGMKENFQKEPSVDSLGTPYDLKSVMHYPSDAFGGGKMTIQVLDPSKQSLIGQRDGFSEIDVKQLNLMYCSGVVKPSTSPGCENKDPTNNCIYWAKQRYCSDNKYKDFMIKNCCKACQDLSNGLKDYP